MSRMRSSGSIAITCSTLAHRSLVIAPVPAPRSTTVLAESEASTQVLRGAVRAGSARRPTPLRRSSQIAVSSVRRFPDDHQACVPPLSLLTSRDYADISLDVKVDFGIEKPKGRVGR